MRMCVWSSEKLLAQGNALDGGVDVHAGVVHLAVASVLVAGDVDLGPSLGGGPVAARGLNAEVLAAALGDTEVAHLSPVLTPGVAHDPVLLGVLLTPAHNGDGVVSSAAAARGNASVVGEDLGRVDTAPDRATCVDLLHHVLLAGHGAVLGDGGVGVHRDGCAEAARRGEGGAGAADVVGLAGGVDVSAEALLGVARACQVGVAGVVHNTARLLRDPRVGSSDGPSVARPGVAAVEDVLHSEVDVDALRLACDLDAVAQGRHRRVGPARPTVLRDVLVQVLRQVAGSVHVTPCEVGGEVLGAHVGAGEGGHNTVLDAGSHLLLLGPEQALLGSGTAGHHGHEHCALHLNNILSVW